jgi:hypothetical protein
MNHSAAKKSSKPGWKSRVCDRTTIIKYIGINKMIKYWGNYRDGHNKM